MLKLLGLIFSSGARDKADRFYQVQRKLALPAFSFRSIKNLYPVFWNKSVELVKCIEADLNKPGRADNVVEITNWAARATLDIVGMVVIGQDFGALQTPDNELNRQYRKMFAEPSKYMRFMGLVGYFMDLRVLFFLLSDRNNMLNESSAYLRSVARKIIQKKQEQIKNKEPANPDIISQIMEAGFTEEKLVSQVMTFLTAGHETTGTALCWVIYALCKHPEMQARLREEIRSNLTSPNDKAEVDAAAVDALAYLNAVVHETLRFHPPVPLTPRQALKDTTIMGTFVPKDSIVIVSAEATCHSTELWGPDAAVYNPDRWMGPGRENTGGSTSNYAFMTFIHGPRSCLGKGFSIAELKCLVALMVGKFEMELKYPDAPLELRIGMTNAPKDGVLAKMKVLEGW